MQATILNIMETFGYPGVFALIAAENLFPPIPSEVILTFGGFLTTCTQLTVWGVIVASTLGSVAGAAVLYFAGRMLTPARIGKILDGKLGRRLHLDRADVEKSAAWFAKRGTWSVLYGRCIPIIRSLVSIPAGMARMKLLPFFGLTTIGSLVWNIILVHLGALAGENWQSVVAAFETLSSGTQILLWVLALCMAAILWRRAKSPKRPG